MRKMSSEMCVSKGSALLSGAQKHLIEITFKLRKRKSDDSSQTSQRGHTLLKEATRFEKVRNEIFCLRQKYGVKGTKARAHLCVRVLLCVSSSPLPLASLSSHFSHANARGTERTKPFGRARDKSKTSGTLGGGVPHSTKEE